MRSPMRKEWRLRRDATAWWREMISTWQRGNAPGASAAARSAARDAERALWPALASLGMRAAQRYGLVRHAGSAAADDVVANTIFELFQVWSRMGCPPDKPAAFAWRRFRWRVRNGLRGPRPVSASVAVDDTGTPLVARLAAPPQGPDPVELPRHVGQTLADATRFAAVALRASRAGVEGLPGPDAEQTWQRVVATADRWDACATYVLDDVERGTGRHRWRHAPRGSDINVAAVDNQQRSWQASYHEFEGHEGYTEAGEMPASKHTPAGQAFDMHLSRFRKSYRHAAKLAGEALSLLDRQTATDAPAQVLAWEPAVHPTLEARTVANRQVAR